MEGDENLRRTLAAAADDLRSGPDPRTRAWCSSGRRPTRRKSRAGWRVPWCAKDLGKVWRGGQSDLVYAPVIHYGWAAHNIPPQPFLADG